jgi:hypothetical protein
MRALLLVLAFIAAFNYPAIAQEAPKCLDVTPLALKDGEVLFLYQPEGQPDSLETLVVFDGKEFKETHNRYFRGISEAFRIDSGKAFVISYDTYSAMPGSDKCFWSAKLEKPKKSDNELFSSAPVKLNTKIDDKTLSYFYSLNTACINQVDSSNNPKSSCTKPILKGTSDINNNGRTEFWFTSPHLRDIGFAIAELDESGNKLKIIAER